MICIRASCLSGQGVVFVGKIIYALAKKLSWLLPDSSSDQKEVLKSLAMTGSVDIARMTAQRKGQGEWFEQTLADNPNLPDEVKNAYIGTRGFIKDDDETFNKSLGKYLTPDSSGTLLNWDTALQQNRERASQAGDTRENTSAWDKFQLSVAGVSEPSDNGGHGSASDPGRYSLPSARRPDVSGDPARATSDAGYWDALLQRIDSLDKQPSRQITDNRKFEYRFEINAAPGQDEKAIADEVSAVTKNNSAFNGDNSLTDGGLIW
ncbi:Uncharacterised protein [Citrobacter koseri]|nr:Uncharacterised protein [Citrobacter koseri]